MSHIISNIYIYIYIYKHACIRTYAISFFFFKWFYCIHNADFQARSSLMSCYFNDNLLNFNKYTKIEISIHNGQSCSDCN